MSDETTILGNEITGPGGEQPDEPQAIARGQKLLDLYDVESDPIKGGMGAVFRVRHTGWGIDLALKRPHAHLFQTDDQKELFTRECEAWINLGLHPHIVSCYYVREIGGVPSIFSEWMDGGSLASWIRDEKLYAGDEGEQMARILDIAIQFARGLHFAHEKGLIHQDVKPENLLLTADGAAKVADFGIANALAVQNAVQVEGETMLSAGGAYTPAYCSIEQMNGEKLTRRTDVWSWAVSVLEMLTGERLWQNGAVAGLACADYADSLRVQAPSGLWALLLRCFEEDEARRPHDFGEIEAELVRIYGEVTGEIYPRPLPRAADDTAGRLNNKALSFIDIGRPVDARGFWEQAVQADPNHLEVLYNLAVDSWRNGEIDDVQALKMVENAAGTAGTAAARQAVALVHMEQGDGAQAQQYLDEARAMDTDNKHLEALATQAAACGAAKLVCMLEAGDGWSIAPPVVLSPDGRYLAVAIKMNEQGDDRSALALFETQTGKRLQSFGGFEGEVHNIVFSRSGGKLLMLAKKGMLGPEVFIHLWNTQTGDLVHTFTGPWYDVHSVDMTPDGKTVMVGGIISDREQSEDVWIFDAKSGNQQSHTVFSDALGQTFARISPDGTQLLVHGFRPFESAYIWRPGERQPSGSLHYHGAHIKSMAVDDSFTRACTCSETELCIWDVEKRQLLAGIEAKRCSNLRLMPGGKWLLADCGEGAVKLWDTAAGRCVATMEGRGKAICEGSGEALFYIGEADGGTGLFRMELPQYKSEWMVSRVSSTVERLDKQAEYQRRFAAAQRLYQEGDMGAALSEAEGARAVPGFENNAECIGLLEQIGAYCRVAGFRGHWIEDQYEHFELPILCASYGTMEKHLMVVEGLGKKQRYVRRDLKTGNDLAGFDFEIGNAASIVAVTPESGGSVYLGADGVYEASSPGAPFKEKVKQGFTVEALAVDPLGSVLVSISQSGGRKVLKVWDPAKKRCEKVLNLEYVGAGSNVSLAMLPDAHTALVGVGDDTGGKVMAIELKGGRTIKQWSVPQAVNMIACGPDGRTFLVGCGNAIYVYRTGSPDPVQKLETEGKRFSVARFAPDPRWIVTGTADQRLTVWDAWSGAQSLVLQGLPGEVVAAQFSGDMAHILSAALNRMAILWKLDKQYEFPGWADWDDGALPYLENFALRYPKWKDADFAALMAELQRAGYGWLRPEGVRARLKTLGKVKQVSL